MPDAKEAGALEDERAGDARADEARTKKPGRAARAKAARAPGDRRAKGKRAKRSDQQGRKRAKAPEGDRPAFAARYPRHPELDRLVDAFEAGNFAAVRAGTPSLMAGADYEAVRDAARDLRRRIDADPTSMFLWALGVTLLVFLFGYYLAV